MATRSRTGVFVALLALAALGARAQTAPPVATNDLTEQVRATERAFAKTMADRDLEAFARMIAEDAVFLGSGNPLRGREAIVAGWRKWFEGPRAPFSWAPERVAVNGLGSLAVSSGPVFDPQGERIGTFTSTWRREASGAWRIVLDSGCPPCTCPPGGAKP